MYKIAAICAIAIGVPHYLLADKKVQVECVVEGEKQSTETEKKNLLFDGRVLTAKDGKTIFHEKDLDKRCNEEFPVSKSEGEDEGSKTMKAVLIPSKS